MKIVLISGSARAQSNTIKVVKWLEKKLQAQSIETYVVDLHSENFPADPDQLKNESGSHYFRWLELSGVLRGADGYVVMTPEWNGMPCGALVSLFDFVDDEMAYKPAYVGTVSSGLRGGSLPVNFLKGGMSKNSMIIPSPEYLVVRDANNVLNTDTPLETSDTDVFTQNRAMYGLGILIEMAERLNGFSQSGKVDVLKYSSGM
jgi:NAD(P)H-dependent FMN reductase